MATVLPHRELTSKSNSHSEQFAYLSEQAKEGFYPSRFTPVNAFTSLRKSVCEYPRLVVAVLSTTAA